MSLLETRNKKFNIPFVFIAGVIFLVGLAYFANYLENMSPKSTEIGVKNEKTIKIRVEENLDLYLDGMKIEVDQLEEQLKIQFEGYANPVILLETSEKMASEKLVKVMEIARTHTYKIILEKVTK